MCNLFLLRRMPFSRFDFQCRLVVLPLLLGFSLVLAGAGRLAACPACQEDVAASALEAENPSEGRSAVGTLLQPVFSFFKAYNDTAHSVADSAGSVATSAEKWASASLPSGAEKLAEDPNSELLGPADLGVEQAPDAPQQETVIPAQVRSRGRAIRAIRLLIVAAGLISAIGLIRLLLHLNHLAHGNYAGRLQFLGWAGSVILLAASLGIALNEDVWDWEEPEQAGVVDTSSSEP